MKPFAHLLVCFILLLNLIVGLHAGLFFVRNGVIYCKFSTRASCDKVTPLCVKITATAPATSTCKYYKSECQYEIDRCLGKSRK
ncbi:hypothetical protein KR093_008770 [Drosophila rubida]|uniref:Uncharacterized protein n=1 Tax=Drosophila rubida TaxID=30044 RepID=A0AAD4K800_9MUSC|nr:hypothetical protein KR093_008770 [Drosophila rubida]